MGSRRPRRGPGQTLRYIVLPLISPAIIAGPAQRHTLDRRVRDHVLHGRPAADAAAVHLHVDQLGVSPEVNAVATVILVVTLGVFALGSLLLSSAGASGDGRRNERRHVVLPAARPVARARQVSEPSRSTAPRTGLLGERPVLTNRSGSASRLGSGRLLGDLMAAGETRRGAGFASLFANDHLMPILGMRTGRSSVRTAGVRGLDELASWTARTSWIPLG